MKKILLSAAAVFAAMSLNAQEICTFNPDNVMNLDADNGSALTAGTIIGETESIVATVGADDSYKPQDVASIINGAESKGGLQGSTNPKDADGGTPSSTLIQPASGAYLQFEAKADGFLYVIHKASSNKAYTVFEEGSAIGYTFAAFGNKEPLPEVYQFTIEGGGEYNYISETDRTKIDFAEQEWLKVNNPEFYEANWVAQDDGTTKWTNVSAGGLGVIKFAVAKDCKYIVNANGSKITAGGFVFSKEDNVLIQSGDVVIYKGEGAAEPVKKVYSVIGTLVGNWDVDTDMELVNGVYSATIDIANAGSYEYKIRQDHDWAINWGDNGDGTGVQDGPNFKAELPANSSITITFDPATAKIDAFVVGGVIDPGEEGGSAIIGEIDWTQQEAFNNWCSGENGSTAVVGAEGLEINVPSAGENYWNPQTVVLNIEGEKVADNPDAPAVLAEDGRYQVIIVAKHPAGHLQVNLGTWDDGVSLQKDFDVEEATDFHEIVVDFSEGWPADCFSNVHVLWQSGALPGLSVLKSIQIIDLDATAIKTVKTGKKFEGAIYNLAGQKVNASYKGVVIKDGKKYIQK
ncbi:MAG: hypothetical protein IKH35_05735 [Prevotella sp.]|nr:hypothetical protein [Prevotella sp.]